MAGIPSLADSSAYNMALINLFNAVKDGNLEQLNEMANSLEIRWLPDGEGMNHES